MTRRPDVERLITALRCGEPDYVPLFEVDVCNETKSRFLGRPVTTPQDEADFAAAAGYDYVMGMIPMNFNPGNRPRKGTRRSEVTTERRNLYGVGEETFGFRAEDIGIISSMADLEAHEWPDPDETDVSMLRDLAKAVPKGMGVMTGMAGPYSHILMLMGFELFCTKSIEEPELIAALFEKVGDICYRTTEIMLDTGVVDVFGAGDDVGFASGMLLPPEIMQGHILPWHRRACGLARSKGMPVVWHSDGDISDILDDLIDLGANGFQPVEPKAMDIVEVKRKYEGRLCVMGNIDMGGSLVLGTPEDVRQEVMQRIREVAPGGGYCIGSSNSVPTYVPFENYRAMVDASLEFGQYPIRV